MKLSRKVKWSIGLLAGAILGPAIVWYQQDNGRMTVLGRRLGKDVARVTKSSDAGADAPIIILEESHASRLQQVEQAIVLTRAYRDERLREVVLEGYLNDRQKIDWERLREGIEPGVRARVGLKQLELGLITGGEYIALVFEDVNLIPGETSKEYDQESAKETEGTILLTAIALGVDALSNAEQEKVAALMDELGKTNGDRSKQKKILKELGELAGKSQPIVKRSLTSIIEPVGQPIEQEIESLSELRKLAQSKAVPKKSFDAIDDFEQFLKARSAATDTMVKALPAGGGDSPKAIIIGAGHGEKTYALLGNSHPFVTLVGESYYQPNDPSDLTPDEYTRRSKGEALQKGGLQNEIFSALQKQGKKPQPGLTFDYTRVENELDTVLFLAHAGGGGKGSDGSGGDGPPTRPAGHPMFWFNRAGGWEGEYWKVEASTLAWVDDDGKIVANYNELEGKPWDPTTRMPAGAKALVFDLKLKAGEGLVYSAKVAPAVDGRPLQESIGRFRQDLVREVEAELLAARDRLRKSGDSNAATDIQPGVTQRRPAWNVDAIISRSRDAVCKANYK